MSQETVMRFGQAALWTAAQIAGPIIISGLVVGLVVSIFQAATQIQEQSLVFVPKIPGGSLPILVLGLLKEVALGVILGWIASLFFASVQMAGEWLDLQSGFQAGQLLNPAFDTHNALLGQFSYLLAGMVFLGTGG